MHLLDDLNFFLVWHLRIKSFDKYFVFLVIVPDSFERIGVGTVVDVILFVVAVLVEVAQVLALVGICNRFEFFVDFEAFKAGLRSCFYYGVL